MTGYEEYPWEPEESMYSRTKVNSYTWKRHRAGASRFEWNKDGQWTYPNGTMAPQCHSCGYREHTLNMERHQEMLYCLSCYLAETNPAVVEAYWTQHDAMHGTKFDEDKGQRTTSSGTTGLPKDMIPKPKRMGGGNVG